MFLLGEVAWFAESCDIEDEVVNKQKKIISEILEENEKWQPFGGRCLDRSATKKFEISETFCINTYRSMFWVFFSRTKVLFVNRVFIVVNSTPMHYELKRRKNCNLVGLWTLGLKC